ncbi:hypothetical protein [Mucilaginibacter sp.]
MASRHWVIGGSLAGGDFFALRLLTPTLLRLSTLPSPVAEGGLGNYLGNSGTVKIPAIS